MSECVRGATFTIGGNMQAMMKNRLQHVGCCWGPSMDLEWNGIREDAMLCYGLGYESLALAARWHRQHQLQLQKYTQASLLWFFFSFSFIFHHLFFSILLYGLWMMRANHKELTCVFQKHSGKHMAKNTTSIRRTKRIGT